jgi:hypothetical protein
LRNEVAAWILVGLTAGVAASGHAQQRPPQGTWNLCGAAGTIFNLGAPAAGKFRIHLVELRRSDPSLAVFMEGAPGTDGRASGTMRVLEPGCQGAGCAAGTLTWDAKAVSWGPSAGDPLAGSGTLTFQGPAGTCAGAWTADGPGLADVEILLRLSAQPPGSIDDLRALSDPTGVVQSTFDLPYGEPEEWWVSIRGARRRGDGRIVERGLVLPAEVELKLGGRLIGTATTDGNGTASFDFLPPEDAPRGRSSHRIEVFARHGEAAGSLLASATVVRGLQDIVVAVEPIESPQPVGAWVTVKGRVLSVVSGLFLDPVEADLTIDAVGRQVPARTDANGFFSARFELSSDAFDARFADSENERWEGLRVSATPIDRDRYRESQGNVRFVLVRKGALSATILTDRAIYFPDDDEVAVTGRVTAGGNPVEATVDLTYDGQQLAVVESGADGRFFHRFSAASRNPGERPGAEHALVAVAHRVGYLRSGRAAAFLVAGDRSAACETGEARILKTTGRSRFWRSSASGEMRYADLVEGGTLLPGTMIETTSSTAALGFDVGGGTGVTVVVGAGTRLEVARYCREATGRVRIGLVVDKPGNIVIDRKVSAGASPDYRIEVVTPAVAISDLRTRYFVNVEEDGTTTVAVVDGIVSVMLPEGGAATEVIAGQRITVRVGETPERARVLALLGQVDPRLVETIGAASGALTGGAVALPNDAGRLARLREIERAVVIEGRWILVRTGTGFFMITIEQLEDYARMRVEIGAIRAEERARLVLRLMRQSREAFEALIRPEMDALQARLGP